MSNNVYCLLYFFQLQLNAFSLIILFFLSGNNEMRNLQPIWKAEKLNTEMKQKINLI